MLSYVAPNFIMLKNILASLLHIYHPCFIVQQGLKSEIYYRFIPLLSFHHCLKNEVCYTFILLVSSHDIMVKNETLQKLFILQKINYLCFSVHFTWKNSGDMTQHFWRVNFRATKPFTITSILTVHRRCVSQRVQQD